MTTRWVAAVALVAVCSLPLVGSALRGDPPPRCAADGVVLASDPRVRVELDAGATHGFCCVSCAERFLDARGAAAERVLVIDEETGAPVVADRAFFVRSRVVTEPATGDRIHVFASQRDAERHAETYRGRLLTGDERPFAQTDGDG